MLERMSFVAAIFSAFLTSPSVTHAGDNPAAANHASPDPVFLQLENVLGGYQGEHPLASYLKVVSVDLERNPKDRSYRVVKDQLGRILSITKNKTRKTQFVYNESGKTAKLVDSEFGTVEIQYKVDGTPSIVSSTRAR